jgi:hypothetical protein
MLKIDVLHSQRFPNDLHMQCVTEIKNLTENSHPATLGVAVQYGEFIGWYNREDEAFDFIRRSKITEAKEQADQDRDAVYNGLYDFVKSSTHHYEAPIAAAARRLKIVIDTFNHPERLTKRSYDAETASIQSLIDNLRAQKADVEQIGLQGWISALESKNNAFEALAHECIEEVVGKPEYNMLQSRRGVEKAMRTMFQCIEALVILKGEADYASYVTNLNAIIKHYNDVFAVRLGRQEASKSKENKE